MAKAKEPINEEEVINANPETELSDEEMAALEADSAKAEAALKEKQEQQRQAREEGQGEKMFSESVVKQMMRDMMKEFKESQGSKDDEDLDPEEMFAKKTVRLPRFKNKFITALKNTNTDEYFPELVIHAYDIWDDQQKKNVAYVTAIFEDGEEFSLQLYTLLTKSTKVDCELIERIETDKSFSNGKVEAVDVDGYAMKGTGAMVKLKVKQAEYRYDIKLPTGKQVIVGAEVINW